jgi:hypothetical protein
MSVLFIGFGFIIPSLVILYSDDYTGCPTRYRTWNFFNNSNTNEDIAKKFEQGYVRCVRNEEECVCSAPNCCDTEQWSASQPGSVASGTPCIFGGVSIFRFVVFDLMFVVSIMFLVVIHSIISILLGWDALAVSNRSCSGGSVFRSWAVDLLFAVFS